MTVGLYLHPEGFPSIISDCLVSYGDGRTLAEPSNLIDIGSSSASTKAFLVRKTLVLPEVTTIASFSGSASHIADFAEQFKSVFPKIVSSEKPMRIAGDLVNSFNQSTGEKFVSMIGFTAVSDGKDYGVHIVDGVKGSPKLKTKSFNECVAHGSGASTLLRWLERWDNGVSGPDWSKAGPGDLLFGFLGMINARRFFNFEQEDFATWGGFLECNTFDWPGQVIGDFSRDYLAIGFHCREKNSTWSVDRLPMQLQYQRTSNGSCVRTLASPNDGNSLMVEFPIEDLFGATNRNQSFDWSSFKPKQVTLAFNFEFEDERTRVGFRTLMPNELEKLISHKSGAFDIDRNFVYGFVEQLVR
jgi:hypothetical protein